VSRIVAHAVALVLLASCGFHLRGVGIDTSFKTAEVREVGRVPTSADVAKLLRGAGVELTDDDSAAAVIELLSQQEDRRGISVTDRARTAEYELSLEVRFRALAPGGAEVIPERIARVQRVYRLDANNIVGSHEQEAIVRSEMQREAARQIVAALEAAMRAHNATTTARTSAAQAG
jgi:LPS-assembly lipoprotein